MVNSCLANPPSAYTHWVTRHPDAIYRLTPASDFRSIISVKHEIWTVSFLYFFKREKQGRNDNFSFALILSKQLLRKISVNTHETHTSIELWLNYDTCSHKINPSGLFGNFLFYACSSKTRFFFSGILTAFFNCKYFSLFKRDRELLGCHLGRLR